MNKTPIPIFETGPNKSFVICHSDLDGCNAVQVCHRWLKEKFGQGHYVEFRKATYERINSLAEDVFKDYKEYRYILIGDISVSKEVLQKLPPNCFIFDHHDTSKFLIDHNQCYWAEEFCGAVVAWKALFPGEKPNPRFGNLMKICNQYDMWRGHTTKFGPPQISHDMNALFRSYGYNKFFEYFYHGFDQFTEDQLAIIKAHWEAQDEAFANTDKFEEYGPHIVFLMMTDQRLDPNYWCNEYISNGKKAVFVYYPGSQRLSLRTHPSLKEKFHAGFFLQNHIQNTNNSKGGHALAAGCSVEGMSSEEILNIGFTLNNELEKVL